MSDGQDETSSHSRVDTTANGHKRLVDNRAALIINADDWGRTVETTDRIFDCVRRGCVSSASAMMFMEDSERAASIAKENQVDTGLHLNVTDSFTAKKSPQRLCDQQQLIARFLKSSRIAQAIFHPGLHSAFEYVVLTQIEEYGRLYGNNPPRIDGHHHMHLCENMLRQYLLPEGVMVRRNFSFEAGEKGLANRMYRKWVDSRLCRRHHLTDYFFSLIPLESNRLNRIVSLAMNSTVEVETHPVNPVEFEFLVSGKLRRWTAKGVEIAMSYGGDRMVTKAMTVNPRI